MADKTSKKGNEKSLSKYLRGVRSEFRKVVWPTKKETFNYSAIVITASVIFAALLTFYDRIVSFILGNIVY